jgi:hypothetical protein
MLEEAARGCRASVKRTASLDSMGVMIHGRYWIGLAFEEPGSLRFQTEQSRIDPVAASNLGVGSVIANPCAPGGLSWRRVAELGSDEIAFYSRRAPDQMGWVEAFLRECLAQARSIETPDQPPREQDKV